jgi:radical SAM superfamily enzyme YgiQ (UPF0313 family)
VYNRVEGKRYRFRSPPSVHKELEELRAAGARHAEFTDSTFNVPLKHAKEVLREIAEHPTGMELHAASMNPLEADEELFELMKKAGFTTAMISAESASDRALKGLGKGYGVSAVRNILRLAEASKFDTFWYFLLGGPMENEDTLDETFKFLDEEVPEKHLVFIGAGIRIQKGSPVETVAREEGVLSEADKLLEPKFYISPELTEEKLMERIKAEVLAHPNYIQVADFQDSRGSLLLARLLGWVRYKRPSWTLVPALNKLFSFFGKKRR